MSASGIRPEDQVGRLKEKVARLKAQMAKFIVGQEEVIDLLIAAVLADGHVLLEGLPGLGKTLMIKTLSQSLSLEFNRIQFTPDLMPADITGTTVITKGENGERAFTFEKGPLFTNLLLADEINRAGPKTQSALLQAMQEREVTIFGKHYPLDRPFLVFATQNPIELAGTYPLPEAQLDRFLFKVNIEPPGEAEMAEIAQRTTGTEEPASEAVMDKEEIRDFRQTLRRIPVAGAVLKSVAAAIVALRPEAPGSAEITRRYVRYGVSPRGLQSLLLAAKVRAGLEGRFNVSTDDVMAYWLPALRHRLILDVGAGMEGVTADQVLASVGPEPAAS